jgi:hypothetical protein
VKVRQPTLILQATSGRQGSRRLRGVTLTAQEEKDLTRVFGTLAGCARRTALEASLDEKRKVHYGAAPLGLGPSHKLNTCARRTLLQEREGMSLLLDTEDFDNDDEGIREDEIAAKVDELDTEIGVLEDSLKRLADGSNKKISSVDLDCALRRLGKSYPRKDIEVDAALRPARAPEPRSVVYDLGSGRGS